MHSILQLYNEYGLGYIIEGLQSRLVISPAIWMHDL